MSAITEAIATRQTQITQLQSDIEILQRAASIVGRKGTTAKATRGQPKAKRKRRKLSAAARKVISEKVRASWAKRKRASAK